MSDWNGRARGAVIALGLWAVFIVAMLIVSMTYEVPHPHEARAAAGETIQRTDHGAILGETAHWAITLLPVTIVGMVNFALVVGVLMLAFDCLGVRREYLAAVDAWLRARFDNEVANAVVILAMGISGAAFLWAGVYLVAASYSAAF